MTVHVDTCTIDDDERATILHGEFRRWGAVATADAWLDTGDAVEWSGEFAVAADELHDVSCALAACGFHGPAEAVAKVAGRPDGTVDRSLEPVETVAVVGRMPA